MQTPLRHIIGWSGLIVIVSLVAVFMSFFFNLSGYNINVRWVFYSLHCLDFISYPKSEKLD